jgi:hypothetical protein
MSFPSLAFQTDRLTATAELVVEAVGKDRGDNLKKNDLRIRRLSDDLGWRDHLGPPIWTFLTGRDFSCSFVMSALTGVTLHITLDV